MTDFKKKAGSMQKSEIGDIDLTEIVNGSVAGDFDDQDIIELTNIVDDNSAEAQGTTIMPYGEAETAIIELTDIVSSEIDVSDSSKLEMVDEEILELTDIVKGETVEQAKSLENEEEIDEFVEVDEGYVEVADVPYEIDEEIGNKTEEEIEDEIEYETEYEIEGSEKAVKEKKSDLDNIKGKDEPAKVKSVPMEFDIEKVKELVKQEINSQLADAHDDRDDKDEKIELEVEPEKIEAAIEKIVQEKFSDNIESVLFNVMEKVIAREISEVKKNLQKDLDNIIKS